MAADINSKLDELGYNLVGTATNFDSAMHMLIKKKPDLVLMDIELEGAKNGIETAAAIKQKRNIPIVFLTQLSSIETYREARLTGPHAYLTKPVSDLDLLQAIDLAIDHQYNEAISGEVNIFHFDNCIFLKQQDTHERVEIEDILYIKADGSYCDIHTTEKKYTLSRSMGKCVRLINQYSREHQLVQVHKSYVVNLKHVKGFKGARLMVGGHEVDVGKTYLPLLKEQIPFL